MERTDLINRLMDGNARYIAGKFSGNISPEKRADTAENGQKPFAVVVACSDSRVIPEAIFDCGVGEIFTVRTAGNTVGEAELGSVQYALKHLKAGLVVVLGHTCCGAVSAALSGCDEEYVRTLTDLVSRNISGEKDPTAASVANAKAGAEKIIAALSPENAEVAAALYDVKTGRVDFFRQK